MSIIKVLSASGPRFSSEDKSAIDLMVLFSHLPGEEVPFTASKHDSAEHGRLLYVAALRGDFGPVQEYSGPSDLDRQAVRVRIERDRLLVESDGFVARALESGDADLLAAVKAYREDLRNIPTSPGFPDNVTWPEKPTF
ncbi:putative tail fiber assembly protein [Stenotrophomonas phage B2]|nr:putative tail fiber assembly protein [Stenotrophomonas phage B2]